MWVPGDCAQVPGDSACAAMAVYGLQAITHGLWLIV